MLLCPHNFNFVEKLVCKLADFGLSRGLVWCPKLEGKVVDNPIWLAPEILQHMKYTEKVDVYAFGVILWEIVSHGDFFGHIDFMTVIEEKVIAGTLITSGHFFLIPGERPPIPPETPKYLVELILQAWDNEPESRPSFRQLSQRLVSKSSIVEPPEPSRFLVLISHFLSSCLLILGPRFFRRGIGRNGSETE